MRTRNIALALSALLAACSGGTEGRDTVGAVSGGTTRPRTVTPAAGSTDTASFATPRGRVLVRGDSAPGATEVSAEPLQWTGDAVIARLADARLAPASAGGIQGGPIAAPGLRVRVMGGAAEVQAFVFGDAAAVGNATRSLDLAPFASGARTATLLTDNNLAAVIITADATLRARIRAALASHGRTGR